MAKKQANERRPSGAASIPTVEDAPELDQDIGEMEESRTEGTAQERDLQRRAKGKSTKAKGDQQTDGSVSLSDIRKAAAFVNSIGGLDKAIGLLQILKVAKEVQ